MRPFVAGEASMRRGSQRQTETRRYTPAMKRLVIVLGSIIVVAGLAVGLLVFKPWLLFVDVRVDDALPTIPQSSATADPTPDATEDPAPPEPELLATGTFISH